jgi:hypothetical protein
MSVYIGMDVYAYIFAYSFTPKNQLDMFTAVIVLIVGAAWLASRGLESGNDITKY